ncbi:hypothetical protein GCM10011514_02290 [Emticicia aquatilis]|uniref:Uncharacterized protein n=1 Tax=Emticicia aquatilis TaxID=1537369 RepID=A0A917DJQ8_9BACT|nr:hypothetical protein [Emticicia aquatilis]GGD41843.1 hypothetical protein GCM10011514_02290 [Emticicia aquatilis]
MSAAQGFYEVYKALPKKVQKEVKLLIENDETVEVSLKAIEKGLEEVKQIRDGKLPRKTFAELKKEMVNEK